MKSKPKIVLNKIAPKKIIPKMSAVKAAKMRKTKVSNAAGKLMGGLYSK